MLPQPSDLERKMQMSRVSREKKEKAAKAVAEGKQPEAEAKPKQGGKVPNEGKCCTCKSYKRCKGRAEPCATTGKYTPRKASCSSYKLR